MNKKEELDLDNLKSEPTKKAGAQSQDPNVNHMDASVSDLSRMINSGMSNEELLQQIIQTPADQLIPWEECHLPSRGLYYGWNDGVIMVRAMGQTAEKVLATQRLAQSGQSIDYLFRECCQFPPGFDSADLLLGDRVFLLYYIRGITHGNLYEFAITCPNEACASMTTHTYDLNELAQTIVWAKPELGTEPFKIRLPYLSKATGRDFYVGVRYLRGADVNDMIAKRKMRKKLFAKPGVKTRGLQNNQRQAEVLDDSSTENMSKVIVSVMDVQDPFMIAQFIEKMHAQDTAAVREWLRENTPGIDNTVSVECPNCNQEFTVELPITESFFRPTKQ
jgi:hypothetical protein